MIASRFRYENARTYMLYLSVFEVTNRDQIIFMNELCVRAHS